MEKLYQTRDAYGETLVELGKKYPDLVVLDADIAKSTKTKYFAEAFPDRFFQMGIAEQNELGVASGMALSNKLVFVSTYAVFATMKALEQIRTYICYTDANVKIVATHGGLTPGNDGATHQGTEDLGIMRTIPNIKIVVPADANSTRALIREIAKLRGPFYVRLARDPLPKVYEENEGFEIGKAKELIKGKDATIIAIGDMVSWGLKASKELQEEDNIQIGVIDMHTLKPLDKEKIVEAAKNTGAIVSLEDHNIFNGLGSAVAEIIAEEYYVPFKRIGIPDCFGESGKYELLLEKYGMGLKDIKNAVREVITKNKI
ncbi:MAG: transketolase family protein [Eubacteriaceae bacterium]